MNIEKHMVTIPIDDYNELLKRSKNDLDEHSIAMIKEVFFEIMDLDRRNTSMGIPNTIQIDTLETRNFVVHKAGLQLLIQQKKTGNKIQLKL
jgi:hypothetical protein